MLSLYDQKLCRDCHHCKTRSVGLVGSRSYCTASRGWGDENRLGVQPWKNTPHPNCPIRKNLKNRKE